MTSPTPTSPPPHRPSKFRFKDAPTNRSRSRSPPADRNASHNHHRRHHHHRSKRRRLSPSPDQPPLSPIDPDIAFRESLFDALADDEGAAYWEGVYGQPIHTWSRPTTSDPNDPTGELEAMTDEEYASYVRARMWEKSHQHVVEERAKREEEKARRKKRDEEGRRWEAGVEEALKRGEERRRGRRWKGAWEGYTKGWETLANGSDGKSKAVRERIPWPVEGGRFEDVGKEEVEMFFKGVVEHSAGGLELGKVLKGERVRWHPDKMMQRMGGEAIDEGTLRKITAVFQVVDRLFGDCKGG